MGVLPKFGHAGSRLRNLIFGDSSIARDAVMTNIQRICCLAVIAVPVSVIHIVKFLFFTAMESADQMIWRERIIFAHMGLILSMTAMGLMSLYLKRKAKPHHVLPFVVQYVTISLILIAGVAIVTIDQPVTPNITPFLVACTITALIFHLRPAVSIPIYTAAYAFYYFSLILTQTDAAILLSNQMNGITATGIGLGLSMILWQNNVKNFRQRECIERQQKELQGKNNILMYLAAYDSMTGLLNRREFTKAANQELSRMQRHQYDSCILMTDIDDFKQINDQYGHPAGDELLKQFASLLKAQLREMDVIARWGGEEFIILLPATTVEGGVLAAERLRQLIEQNDFCIDSGFINVTASFGVSALSHSAPEPFQTSYEGADKALYSAKNKGKNCVVVAGEAVAAQS